ncbi:hypothetical protein SDC9_95188 [bioreactor metagenome]|uniref:Adenine DNA glycosylase C-terminal domain-containing protein n=2 Tax=root TaxID=1 RepID=A0A645AC77_9ZZZZ
MTKKEQSWPAAVAEPAEDSHHVVMNAQVWYEIYQRVVKDRSQDKEVRDMLEQQLKVKGPIYHVFSHRRWEMYWVVIQCPKEMPHQEDIRWVTYQELEKIAFPVAFQKVLEEVKSEIIS